MISREKIERALRDRVRGALKSSIFARLQNTADQREAAIKAGVDGVNQETQATLLEAALLEHQLRFAPLRKILNGYRDDLGYFRDKYAPSSKIFTWECYESPYGPGVLWSYGQDRSYAYTEGFFLEEPTVNYPHLEKTTGIAFTIQGIVREGSIRKWQEAIGIQRTKKTYVLARIQAYSWRDTSMIYPFWEHIANRAKEAEKDFYPINGYAGGKDLEISQIEGKGTASTPWGYHLFTTLPFRKNWISWGNKTTAGRLEQQIVDALAPFEIRREAEGR